MLKSLAREVAKDGILVHHLAPGRILTDRILQLDRASAERLGISMEAVRENMKRIYAWEIRTPRRVCESGGFSIICSKYLYDRGNYLH